MVKEIFVVIGKLPEKGFSKTRLAKDVGEELALNLYKSFIEDFFNNYKIHRSNTELYFFGTPESEETKNYFHSVMEKYDLSFEFFFQKEAPFFSRLKDIFENIQKLKGKCFIHLTGTDIPDFPFSLIQSDLITSIGPDEDGGFYYLGAYSDQAQIFDLKGVKEGGDTVFQAIINKLNDLGSKPRVLRSWSDIDDVKDLNNCIGRSAESLIPKTYSVYNKDS